MFGLNLIISARPDSACSWYGAELLRFVSGHGFTGCEKMLYGREDVSGHGFIRAAKLLKMNNSALPKACAQPGELFVSAVPREPRARAKPSDEKQSAQNKRFPQPLQPGYTLSGTALIQGRVFASRPTALSCRKQGSAVGQVGNGGQRPLTHMLPSPSSFGLGSS